MTEMKGLLNFERKSKVHGEKVKMQTKSKKSKRKENPTLQI